MYTFSKKINKKINEIADEAGYPYKLFGIFALISYPLYYIIWAYFDPQGYESIPMRLVATILPIPLIFKDYWPTKIKPYLPLFWYLCMLFCFPIFFTFMLLKNNLSYGWVLNTLTGLVLTILLLDTLSLIFLLPLGIFLGWLLFQVTGSIAVGEVSTDYKTILITYGAVIIFGVLFAHKKEKSHHEKLHTIKTISAAIAHELRTPLRAISLSIEALKQFLPDLLQSYQAAKAKNLDIPYVKASDCQSLPKFITIAETETQASFNIIDMLLVKAELSNIQLDKFKVCSIAYCVEEALRRYAFDMNEKNLVSWKEGDFSFNGNEILIIHVLFNLLKNAIYYIKHAGKGEITIWCESHLKYNELHFKDTGEGIHPKDLKRIFDRFFTKTPHGTGIGLTFCKLVMESHSGYINCNSKKGEFTEFTLLFPKT